MYKKHRIFIWIISAVFILSSVSITYIKFPAISAKIDEHRSFASAHLKLKKVKIKGETITYLEAGKGPTLFFVHGFQGNKRYWVKYAGPLVSSYHIVIPDLPAHGESSCSKDQKFDLKSLSYALDDFVKAKKIDNFQLIGASMGAAVCLKYSVLFPEKVKKMVLINPVGIKPKDEKEFLDLVVKNQRLFFPSTIEELDELNISLRGIPLPYNNRLKHYILDRINKKKEIYRKAYIEFVYGEDVENELFKIKAPTLIISGKFDKISRLTDLEIYSEKIPNCTSIILDDGYHIFRDKAFEKSQDEMIKFINK